MYIKLIAATIINIFAEITKTIKQKNKYKPSGMGITNFISIDFY
jgi:hypothetical protein